MTVENLMIPGLVASVVLALAASTTLAADSPSSTAQDIDQYRNRRPPLGLFRSGRHPSRRQLLHGGVVVSLFSGAAGAAVQRSGALDDHQSRAPASPRFSFQLRSARPVEFDDSTERIPFRMDLGHRYAAGVWAPSIRYHKGRFYVYFATPSEGVFMATAKRAEGPWSKVTQVIDSPNLEDPGPFWDDDGNAYLVHSRVGAGPLVLRRMSADGTKVLDEGKIIVEAKIVCRFSKDRSCSSATAITISMRPMVAWALDRRPCFAPETSMVHTSGAPCSPKARPTCKGRHQGGYIETPSGRLVFALQQHWRIRPHRSPAAGALGR